MAATQGRRNRSSCSGFGRTSFSQGKSKILFLQKASNKQSASMILGLIRLIMLDRKGIESGARLSAAHAFRSLLCSQGTLLCKS